MLLYLFIQDQVFLQINTESMMQGYSEQAIFISDFIKRNKSSCLADLTPYGMFDSFCLAHQGPNW